MTESQTRLTQYLTFKLGKETFAIPISNVREVLKLPDLTDIPGTPDFIRGVINVRGSVVSVVDLNRKFGKPLTIEDKKRTRIIIVESLNRGKKTVIGAMADSVDEVLDLMDDQIEPPPDVGIDLKTDFVVGVGKSDGRFIILLDVGRVFSTEEMILMQTTRQVEVRTDAPERV